MQYVALSLAGLIGGAGLGDSVTNGLYTDPAMAIFAGDIPSCLLRMPGTPASAAYTDEAYAMTKKGQGEIALGAGLVRASA